VFNHLVNITNDRAVVSVVGMIQQISVTVSRVDCIDTRNDHDATGIASAWIPVNPHRLTKCLIAGGCIQCRSFRLRGHFQCNISEITASISGAAKITFHNRAGWPEMANCYRLRHSYSVRLLLACGNKEIVQKALGHANISTTDIYTSMVVDPRLRTP